MGMCYNCSASYQRVELVVCTSIDSPATHHLPLITSLQQACGGVLVIA
jgi:hypothetical protein